MSNKTSATPSVPHINNTNPPRSIWITQDTQGQQVTAQALLGGQDELHILHGERRYTLRKTKQNKLILVA
jgi:hemin uptake protein HemP